MSKKDVINAIEVKTPCGESWHEMQGNEKVRFCSHCAKDVNNISEMTRKEALRLVRRSEGRLCVQYIKDPKTSRPLFSENLYKITRRAPGLAAGVMTASMVLSTAAYAQDAASPERPEAEVQLSRSSGAGEIKTAKTPTGGISSYVVNEQGASIPGTAVTLRNSVSGQPKTVVADAEGGYEFNSLPVGEYSLLITAPGFKAETRHFTVEEGQDIQIWSNTMLAPAEFIAVGGMISLPLPKIKNPLSIAVQNDDLEEVNNLITRHAKVNSKEKDRGDITPLFIAVENGNLEIAEALLRFGARVNARDTNRQTPLMMLDDDATAELVDLLVKYGAHPDLTDNGGNTALILATDTEPDVSVIQALLDAGADVNHQNDEGETALMKAANHEDLDAARILILAGADVNLKNSTSDTALDYATSPELRELIESHGGRTGHPEWDNLEDTASGQPIPDDGRK